MKNKYSPEELASKANSFRIEIIKMAYRAQEGHIGGAYSIIDIMTALYYNFAKIDPKNLSWPARDKIILSKGHCCLALYPVLADLGYFEKSELETFCKDGSRLGGHPERDLIPGVEATTGSLGHGLSLGIGMALAAKLDKKDNRVFVILGDGECNEGSVWEAFMSAAQFKLNNLTAIIDSNKYESLDKVSEILNIDPLGEKLKLFGWRVKEIDGHDMPQIVSAFDTLFYNSAKPSAIIAHTVKGKGVSFIEKSPVEWHAKKLRKEQELKTAISELERLI